MKTTIFRVEIPFTWYIGDAGMEGPSA